MAKKRKHHSTRSKMHQLYREADRMDRDIYFDRDRRGRVDGEHHGMGREAVDYPMSARAEGMAGGPHMRVMRTNNGGRGPINEDFRNPCGLPYGAIQRDLGNGTYFSMNGFRVGDLYEQVDKNMREDAAAIKTITKPTNW